jgi:hypothetical protein
MLKENNGAAGTLLAQRLDPNKFGRPDVVSKSIESIDYQRQTLTVIIIFSSFFDNGKINKCISRTEEFVGLDSGVTLGTKSYAHPHVYFKYIWESINLSIS